MRSNAKRHTRLSALRIMAYIKQHWDGNTTHAAKALGVSHNKLWRSANGLAAKGPSVDICAALEKHSASTGEPQPMLYWAGRAT